MLKYSPYVTSTDFILLRGMFSGRDVQDKMSSWLSHKRCFDTVVESIDLVFEFCEEISHRLCVVVQFVQKPSLMFTN